MLSGANPGARRWIYQLVVVLVIGAFCVRGLRAIEANTNASAYDQRSYLNLGLRVREGRGLTDGKRNPLLPLLLSTLAERDWPYYTRAKLLNLGIGVVCLLLTYQLGRRWFHPAVGALATALFGLNAPFLHLSSHVMAESLLIACSLVGWWAMDAALGKEKGSRISYGVLAGAACGLAYMAKGTALQMVPAFVLVAVLVHRGRVWRRREVWVFLVAWLVACSPLLVWNVQKYGDPFYSRDTRHELFLDSPTQRHFGDLSDAPTLGTYLRSHSVDEMAARLATGTGEVILIAAKMLANDFPDRISGTRWHIWLAVWLVMGLVLAIALVVRWRMVRERFRACAPAYWLLSVMLVLTILPLGWFMQASEFGPRFVVVFHPMGYIAVLGALWMALMPETSDGGVTGIRAPVGMFWLTLVPLCGLALWAGVLGWRDLPHISRHPVAVDRRANERPQAVLDWIERGKPRGTRVMWGPSYTLPNWIYEGRLAFKDLPSAAQNWDDVAAFGLNEKTAYAILDWEMAQRRDEALSAYFTDDYPWVVTDSLPPAWAPVLLYDGIPTNWAVFRLVDAVPLAHPMAVDLGDGIRLIGYELHPEVVAPGQNVHLLLCYEALGAMDRNYTLFVHVLDEAGRPLAQSDGWPVDGHYATSQWQPGDTIGDRRTLNLPQGTVPGEYRLAVGAYLFETMERLPAQAADGERLANDLILLDEPLRVAAE